MNYRFSTVIGLCLIWLAGCSTMPGGWGGSVRHSESGISQLGEWTTQVEISSDRLISGATLKVEARLQMSERIWEGLAARKIQPDGMVMLVTAERTFDTEGRLRLASDEKMSTLLTPTGLPIEGGVQGAVTNRFGYGFKTPVDELVKVPLSAVEKNANGRTVNFTAQAKLPAQLPPGIYRLRLDYGVTVKNRFYSLNGENFARHAFLKEPCDSETFSPLLRASGQHVGGRDIDAVKIKPRLPWIILEGYNANGYRGVIAEEDRPHFAISNRNLIQDTVILPLYDEKNPRNKLAYNLEPRFPTETIKGRQNIPWDAEKGELSIQVTGPDGKTVDLGKAPFVGRAGRWLTTKDPRFTQWRPQDYGQYEVKLTGWTQDIWGNRYEGGGRYRFWIAKRMTLATATFQGQPYVVGSRYGRDLGFAPAVPAEVQVKATLFVNSDPRQARSISYSGKATAGGIFGAAQGMKFFPLDAPGEYQADILAKYTDADGHLWVSAMRHAGVVYPADTPIVAHGKKLKIGKELVERGESKFEGWHDRVNDTRQLDHIDFPYNAGDVLLIASEQQGANKIEPVLTWARKGDDTPYDAKIQGIGLTNVRLQTSNGYSPHLFPEYITDWQYFYASAPRPGFMGRFMVAESGSFAPYWPTSRHNFGGQINATQNGDMPGDIYRLMGGVVIRSNTQAPMYAGYMANAFILPKGSNNNRVIAPGSEDLPGPEGNKARIFLALNARPGMVYETGATFVPAIQIDPVLPVKLRFTLIYPDGRAVSTEGVGDETGTFVGKERWPLEQPGVYRYTIDSDWNGHRAVVPGIPKDGGRIFVIEKERPVTQAKLSFDLPPLSRFDAEKGVLLKGSSTAKVVHYAAVMPGAVLMQGELPVRDGKFELFFDPVAINKKVPTYEITNFASGKPEIGDVVHLTFFTEETAPTRHHAFVRLILRGNTVHYTR